MRPYHSPSSISLGLRCKRAWAYQYIARLRDPFVAWREDMALPRWDHGRGLFVLPDGSTVTAAQRGASLGGVMHETAERYLDPSRGKPDWHSFPGQVFQSGRHHMPDPAKIDSLSIEAAIGREPLPTSAIPHARAPSMALVVHGIRWAGYRDVLIDAPSEWRRLGLDTERPVIVDYKSTSNIATRAMTPAELGVDVQASLYAIDYCEATNDNAAQMRWIYFEAKRDRRSLPVDRILTLSRAYDNISPCADLARELDTITRVEDAEQNPSACSDFGPPDRINCRHHTTNGGPCNARRPFGPLVTLKPKPKEAIKMALSAEQQAKFAKAKPAAPATDDAANEIEKSDAPQVTQSEEAQAPAPRPKAVAKTKHVLRAVADVPVAPAAPQSTAALVASLAAELADADAVRDGVLARLRAAVA